MPAYPKLTKLGNFFGFCVQGIKRRKNWDVLVEKSKKIEKKALIFNKRTGLNFFSKNNKRMVSNKHARAGF